MSDYTIRFDFDCEGEAPRVYICGPSGSDDIEVIEEPLFRGKQFDESDPNGFSWDDDDWSPGPLAVRILAFLNGETQ